MERLRRRPEPAAIDITWVSCRGVKSSLPFHTPCLYASIFVVSSSDKSAHGGRRRHRVKTPTDRAGGENPEWDAPLRLYLPDASSRPLDREPEAVGKSIKKDRGGDESSESEDVLLVKFELKAEVAVLGDVHAASAAVPVPGLVADGRTRRVSYQLVGPDGRQPNGVISFSYAFHERNGDDDDGQCSSSDGEPATPPCLTPAAVALLPPPTIAATPRLYPAIEWTLTEQPSVYPPVTTAEPFAVADALCYPPPPPPPVKPAAVYPPPPVPETTSFCGVYPVTAVEPTVSALYPTVDLAPVSYYPPLAPPPPYGAGCGYAEAPGWGDRCLYS